MRLKEQDANLEGDFRDSLKLLTNRKQKQGQGRRPGIGSPYAPRVPSPSPLSQPSPQAVSPTSKRRPNPDYGVLGTPQLDVGGVALGEKPIQTAYTQSLTKHDNEDHVQDRRRSEKDRLCQEELDREGRFQAEERGKNEGGKM